MLDIAPARQTPDRRHAGGRARILIGMADPAPRTAGDGAAVINADDAGAPMFIEAARKRGLAVLTYGTAGEAVRLEMSEPLAEGQRLRIAVEGRSHDVVLPLVAGVLTRHAWLRAGPERLARGIDALKPWSMAGLVATVVLLFGFQAGTLVAQPLVIVLIAVPLVLQSYGIFFVSALGARWLRLPHEIAAPACMIGTSNFFELAVAVAISLFGLRSGAALATVVGVLVEVPVMLSLVAIANRTRHWFPAETRGHVGGAGPAAVEPGPVSTLQQ